MKKRLTYIHTYRFYTPVHEKLNLLLLKPYEMTRNG